MRCGMASEGQEGLRRARAARALPTSDSKPFALVGGTDAVLPPSAASPNCRWALAKAFATVSFPASASPRALAT